MNDKNLLTEDSVNAVEENSLDSVMPTEKDSPSSDQTDTSASVATGESENTAPSVKPKRKYTRKTPVKNTDAEPAQKNDEVKDEAEAVKPKRKYTRRSAPKSEDTAPAAENEAENTRISDTETISNDVKDDSSEPERENTEQTTEADVKEPSFPSDSSQGDEPTVDNLTPDLFVAEEFSFIPELTEDIFEDNQHEISLSEEPASVTEVEEPTDRILPPDELFADRFINTDEAKNSDNSPEITEEIEQADTVIDEDGQYRFTELDEPIDEPTEPPVSEPIQEKYDPKKPRRIDGRFDLLELFVFTLLAVMIATTFLFRHSIVEGSSMENTLHSGEHLIISDLFYTPKRGDIIVCEDYTTAIPKPIVKRVIAVAGDTIEIKSNGNIYINGELQEENYLYINQPNYEYKELILRVPTGELFVMGDHRNESTDSREIGTVSQDSVLGKVLLRFYPIDKFGTVK